MDIKKLAIVSIILLAIGVTLGSVVSKKTVVVQNPPVEQRGNLGAATGPDISSPYISFGGVRSWAFNTPFSTAIASSSCNIEMPSATTSLVSASASVTALGSTSTVVLGWASGPNATTTTIGSVQIQANTQAVVLASSTAQTFLVPPSNSTNRSYVNLKFPGGAAFTAAPTGTCNVVVREVQ